MQPEVAGGDTTNFPSTTSARIEDAPQVQSVCWRFAPVACPEFSNSTATSGPRSCSPSRGSASDLCGWPDAGGGEGQAAAPALDEHCWQADKQVQGLPVRRSASDARAPFDFERSARSADASTLAIRSFASRVPPCARPRARRGPQRARLPARRRPRFSTERENRISDLLVG